REWRSLAAASRAPLPAGGPIAARRPHGAVELVLPLRPRFAAPPRGARAARHGATARLVTRCCRREHGAPDARPHPRLQLRYLPSLRLDGQGGPLLHGARARGTLAAARHGARRVRGEASRFVQTTRSDEEVDPAARLP